MVLNESYYDAFPAGTVGCLLSSDSTETFIILPPLKYDRSTNQLRLDFNASQSGALSPKIPASTFCTLAGQHPLDGLRPLNHVAKLDHASGKSGPSAGRIAGDLLSVGSTLAFALGTPGVILAAGLQLLRFAFRWAAPPQPSAFVHFYDNIKTIVEDQSRKDLITAISGPIQERSAKLERFQNMILPYARDGQEAPGSAYLKERTGEFREYISDPADQLPQKLDQLVAEGWGPDAMTIYLSGLSVHLLCWRYFLILTAAQLTDSADDRATMRGYVHDYVQESMEWIAKAERVVHDTAAARLTKDISIKHHRRVIKDQVLGKSITIGRKATEGQAFPGSEEVNRYLYNSLYQFHLDYPDVPQNLADLSSAQQLWAQLIASYEYFTKDFETRNLRTIRAWPHYWMQRTPQGERWVPGGSVQYGVQFKYLDRPTSLSDSGKGHSPIYWSDKINLSSWALPSLDGIPVDPSLSATARVLWRRFGDGEAEILYTFGEQVKREYYDGKK